MKSNSLKRILAFLLVLCMTFSLAVSASAAEGDPSASLALDVSRRGNTVTAVVSLTDTSVALSGIEFKLGFDTTKLSYKEAYGEIFGFSFPDAANANNKGYVYAGGTMASGETTATGTIATISFTVKDGASGDAAFTLISGNGFDKDAKAFALTVPAAEKLNIVDYQVTISGANMTLGNNLAMNFYIDPAGLDYGENYTAVITKSYADNREDLVVKTASSAWVEYQGLYRVSLNKVAAKEMADKITVVVCNDKGEVISNVWEDSVQDYTMRNLKKEAAMADANKDLLAMYVEMLNYGAAAQAHFEYNASNLANNELTAAQKALGLSNVEMKDSRVPGTGYVGSSLTLESNILMNFFFNTIPAEHDDMYAIASYTDHYGKAKEVKIAGKDFVKFNSTTWKVSVAGLVVADCRQPVEVKVYDASGAVIASVTDSIESYTARMNGDGPLYVAIMKFAVAAYNYFH